MPTVCSHASRHIARECNFCDAAEYCAKAALKSPAEHPTRLSRAWESVEAGSTCFGRFTGVKQIFRLIGSGRRRGFGLEAALRARDFARGLRTFWPLGVVGCAAVCVRGAVAAAVILLERVATALRALQSRAH